MGWQNDIFDAVMPILRNKYTWYPFYLFLLGFLLLNYRLKGVFIVLGLALVIGLSDSTSSHLIKKNVQRARPCKLYDQPKDIHLLVGCGSGYSFPSSHAANHFSMAVFLLLSLGRVFRRIKIPLLLWAACVSFAQVYVGVHYPLDVVAGALAGSLLAVFIYVALKPYFKLEVPF